jgi:hypothetical protein
MVNRAARQGQGGYCLFVVLFFVIKKRPFNRVGLFGLAPDMDQNQTDCHQSIKLTNDMNFETNGRQKTQHHPWVFTMSLRFPHFVT